MQGDCERDRELFCRKAQHLVCQPTSRYCNVSLADMQAIFIRKHLYEFYYIVKIVKRLADSHKNHMGNPFPCPPLDLIDLAKHF